METSNIMKYAEALKDPERVSVNLLEQKEKSSNILEGECVMLCILHYYYSLLTCV